MNNLFTHQLWEIDTKKRLGLLHPSYDYTPVIIRFVLPRRPLINSHEDKSMSFLLTISIDLVFFVCLSVFLTIRFYRVLIYNLEDVVLCALPYHDTCAFLSIWFGWFPLVEPTTWNWLQDQIKPVKYS